MKYQLTILTLLLLTSLSISSRVPFQTPQDDSDKPIYRATGNDISVAMNLEAFAVPFHFNASDSLPGVIRR